MTLISRVWNSIVGGSTQTAPLQVETKSQPAGEPRDSFSFGVIQSPLLAEIEKMAREMAASAPPETPCVDVMASTEATFNAHYGEAVDKQLKSKGLDPLNRRQKKSVAETYQVAAGKLGSDIAVRTAGQVMAREASPAEVAALTRKQFQQLSIPAVPATHFQNVPVHLSKQISVAASGPQAIYLNPIVAGIPESPFKQFMLGHEKHHVDSKDAMRQLGYYHLQEQLRDIPGACFEVEKAVQRADHSEEYAADRAGVDSALRSYSPQETESTIAELLGVFKDEGNSHSHPATEERMRRISAHISRRTAEARQPARKTGELGFRPVISNPIFDELARMAKGV